MCMAIHLMDLGSCLVACDDYNHDDHDDDDDGDDDDGDNDDDDNGDDDGDANEHYDDDEGSK